MLGELIRDASLQQCIEPVDRVVGNVGEDEAQIRFGAIALTWAVHRRL